MNDKEANWQRAYQDFRDQFTKAGNDVLLMKGISTIIRMLDDEGNRNPRSIALADVIYDKANEIEYGREAERRGQ